MNLRSFFDQYPIIYTDGSSSQKTGWCAWAVIIMHDGKIIRQKSGAERGTNDLAELRAVVEALKMIPPNGIATIYSDAKYAIGAMTEWRAKWERNGYRTASGKIVKHLELIKEGHQLLNQRRRVAILHVRGHSGVYGNELADRLAKKTRLWVENEKKQQRT